MYACTKWKLIVRSIQMVTSQPHVQAKLSWKLDIFTFLRWFTCKHYHQAFHSYYSKQYFPTDSMTQITETKQFATYRISAQYWFLWCLNTFFLFCSENPTSGRQPIDVKTASRFLMKKNLSPNHVRRLVQKNTLHWGIRTIITQKLTTKLVSWNVFSNWLSA